MVSGPFCIRATPGFFARARTWSPLVLSFPRLSMRRAMLWSRRGSPAPHHRTPSSGASCAAPAADPGACRSGWRVYVDEDQACISSRKSTQGPRSENDRDFSIVRCQPQKGSAMPILTIACVLIAASLVFAARPSEAQAYKALTLMTVVVLGSLRSHCDQFAHPSGYGASTFLRL